MVRALVLCMVVACASKDGTAFVADAPGDEVQPTPASGDGVADAQSSSLHDHACGGVSWQLLDGWLIVAHAAVSQAPAGEVENCVSRYAGWVTNEADAASVSRASVYAALAATGQCDAAHDYDGTMISGALCSDVTPGVDADACAAHMASSRAFGISTLAKAIAKSRLHDPPLLAAHLATGAVACGSDRWKIAAPDGFVDHFVAAYNSVRALASAPTPCKKHIIVSVALYSGLGEPGDPGVPQANGCWTYERVSKDDTEWKICQYDGTVYHSDGGKWAYDDTNTLNNSTTESARITACRANVPVGGYIYMANRGAGWRQVTSTGVRSHFAELLLDPDRGRRSVLDVEELRRARRADGELRRAGHDRGADRDVDAAHVRRGARQGLVRRLHLPAGVGRRAAGRDGEGDQRLHGAVVTAARAARTTHAARRRS